MIGGRLKQARLAAGFSMEQLAQQVNLSRNMIKKYEHDESMPRSDTMSKMAQALNVRVDYFFRPMNAGLNAIKYRTCSNTPQRLLKAIKADIEEQIERWFELKDLWPNLPIGNYQKPDLKVDFIDSMVQIEDVADDLRVHWDLGRAAIHNLIDVLEQQGIGVIITSVDTDNQFDGLVGTIEGHPFIVVSDQWPGDRQRFTLAHELGHLIMDGVLCSTIDEELACNRFAGAFLLPRNEVHKQLGKNRKKLELLELHMLKQEYGLSMQGCIHRAADLQIISDSYRQQLRRIFKQMDWRKKEPGRAYPNEQTHLFKQLVYRALAESMITESKAAELLGISVTEFYRERKLESMCGAAG